MWRNDLICPHFVCSLKLSDRIECGRNREREERSSNLSPIFFQSWNKEETWIITLLSHSHSPSYFGNLQIDHISVQTKMYNTLPIECRSAFRMCKKFRYNSSNPLKHSFPLLLLLNLFLKNWKKTEFVSTSHLSIIIISIGLSVSVIVQNELQILGWFSFPLPFE